MKVRLITDVVQGNNVLKAEQIVDLGDAKALALIKAGRAEKIKPIKAIKEDKEDKETKELKAPKKTK